MRRIFKERTGTARLLYGRRWGFVVIASVIFGVLSLWRDEGPQDLQPPLLSDILTWLPWWTWFIFVLAILLILTFEGSHREISRIRADYPRMQAENEQLIWDNGVQQKELEALRDENKILKDAMSPVLSIEFHPENHTYFQLAKNIPIADSSEVGNEQRYRIRIGNSRGTDILNLKVEALDITPYPEGFVGRIFPLGFMNDERREQTTTVNANGEVFVDVAFYWTGVHLVDYEDYIFLAHVLKLPNMMPANKYTLTIRATASNVPSTEQKFIIWLENNDLRMGRLVEASATLRA